MFLVQSEDRSLNPDAERFANQIILERVRTDRYREALRQLALAVNAAGPVPGALCYADPLRHALTILGLNPLPYPHALEP
jgi:hypothetical protein